MKTSELHAARWIIDVARDDSPSCAPPFMDRGACHEVDPQQVRLFATDSNDFATTVRSSQSIAAAIGSEDTSLLTLPEDRPLKTNERPGNAGQVDLTRKSHSKLCNALVFAAIHCPSCRDLLCQELNEATLRPCVADCPVQLG